MADLGIWTKNAMIQAKAGVNANATAKAVTATDIYVLETESFVNAASRFNWSDAYAGLNVDVKSILHSITSSMCAMTVIATDMSGFTSQEEAQTMLDVLREEALRGLSILRDVKARDFINAA